MPNVLDISPVHALAKRASARIGDPAIAKRYQDLAADRVLANPRSFRPASETELEKAPRWTRDAIKRGETISVFRSSTGMSARLNTVARALADTCRLAAMDHGAKPEHETTIKEARRFLAKFDRVNFDTAASKALSFQRALASWEGDLDAIEICPAQSIVLLGGRIWHRVTSVAELRGIGREFYNCLARSSRVGGYGAMLSRGRTQFWVLRDIGGKGLIVACAPAPLADQFIEVKGPRNAHVPPNHPDLVQLGIAIGVAPTPPKPPRPTAPQAFATLPPGMLTILEQLQQPCRCNLCQPLARPLRLRRRIGTP